MTPAHLDLLLETCLLAGKIMMKAMQKCTVLKIQ